jgi:hypothetical protein
MLHAEAPAATFASMLRFIFWIWWPNIPVKRIVWQRSPFLMRLPPIRHLAHEMQLDGCDDGLAVVSILLREDAFRLKEWNRARGDLNRQPDVAMTQALLTPSIGLAL